MLIKIKEQLNTELLRVREAKIFSMVIVISVGGLSMMVDGKR